MKGFVIDLEEPCGLGFVSARSPQRLKDRHPLNVYLVALYDAPQREIAPALAGRG
jgi:hypothetical protein